jgi:hypothetical protein
MLPPAPALFSTTMAWPSGLAMASAKTRAMMSVVVPGPKGTIRRTGRPG